MPEKVHHERYHGPEIKTSRYRVTTPEQTVLHVHEGVELIYCAEGELAYLVEGSRCSMRPGDLLILRPGEAHRLAVEVEMNAVRIVLQTTMEALAAMDPAGVLRRPFFDRPLGKLNLYRPEDFSTELYRLCFECLSDASSPLGEAQERESKAPCILGEVYKAYRGRLARGGWETADGSQIGRIITYINENLAQPMSLEGISRRFFMSPSQLNRTFRRTTGSSVWEYVTTKRLAIARGRIRTGVPAGKAYTAGGFSDYSAFFRSYKACFGVSPRQDMPGAADGKATEIKEEDAP